MAPVSTNGQSEICAPDCLSSALDPEAILQELDAICSHRQFSLSRKNREFLRYVVSETLAGRGDELKERTLGVTLYSRSLSYDTGSDAIVRVRANDLRKRLSCYYEEHKSIAGWRIHLPLHSYVPVFQPEAEEQEATAHDISPDVRQDAAKPVLSLWQLMQPTLLVLFLCAATFRWEVFSSTPYQDFWSTLLSGRSGIVLILDAHSSDPGDISIDDVNLSEPLQKTALAFHTPIRIESSANSIPGDPDAVFIHLTHNLPRVPQAGKDPDAAYIGIVPGRSRALWIGSGTSQGLELAIESLSNADEFPFTLERALPSRTECLVRISRKSNGQLSAVADDEPWPR